MNYYGNMLVCRLGLFVMGITLVGPAMATQLLIGNLGSSAYGSVLG